MQKKNQPLAEVFDSLTQIEIYNELDDIYDIDVEFEEIVALTTFDEIVDLVFSKLSESI